MGLGDTGATVSVLASLQAEIAFRLPDAVADARDQGYTWNQIAMHLATTTSAARHRHATYARSRRDLYVHRPSSSRRIHVHPTSGPPLPGENALRDHARTTSERGWSISALLKSAALDAGVPLRNVQEAASHADPRTTMR